MDGLDAVGRHSGGIDAVAGTPVGIDIALIVCIGMLSVGILMLLLRRMIAHQRILDSLEELNKELEELIETLKKQPHIYWGDPPHLLRALQKTKQKFRNGRDHQEENTIDQAKGEPGQ